MVPGLVRVPNFVTPAEEEALVRWFGIGIPVVAKSHPGQRRRIVRYGPGVAATGYVSGDRDPVIPKILADLSNELVRQGLVTEFQNAITVNEYAPGEAIPYHTDHATAGEVITTLGLWGEATLSLQARVRGSIIRHDIPFPRRMLVQLTGVCRYAPWKHAILPVTQHRFSIVFRHGEPNRPGIVQTDLDGECVE